MNYVPLFEQYINTLENGVLIIVDVQIPFKKWWIKNGKDNLPEDIAKKANLEFNQTIQIWDDHKADGPDIFFGPQEQNKCDGKNTFFIKNLQKNIKKHYGVDSADGKIKDFTKILGPEDSKRALELQKSETIVEPTIFKRLDGGYLLRVLNGNHMWFFVSEDLYDTINGIQGDIYLCGGAEGECLNDIENLCKKLGKNYQILNDLCYNATDTPSEEESASTQQGSADSQQKA